MKHEIFRWQRRASRRALGRLAVLRRDDNGATAIEFAMVSMPFLMLLFGLIAVGLHFFTTFTLENAVDVAARPLLTGEAQTAGMTKDQFKASICGNLPAYVECDGKLRINVQNFNVGDAITPPACVDAGGALVESAATSYAPGTANQIVLVTACLQFDLAGKIPFLQLGKMSGGAALLQASTTFKIEPFTN